jgi:uncharacterized membrane protein YfcA
MSHKSPEGSEQDQEGMMIVDGVVLAVLGVILLATLVRSALGFGEALIAVPLLALVIPVEMAAPLACLVSITVAAVILLQDRHHVHLAGAWRLVLSTLPGIPLGLLLLTAVAEPIVKAILGVIIFTFSTWCLVGRKPPELSDDRWAWPFGFAAGVLGGAYGMNGPPLVVYGTLRRWSPGQLRATLQGYFLLASLAGMVGYALAGLWVTPVTHYYLLSLPLVVLAIFLGRVANRRLDARSFVLYVHAALIVVGLVLVTQSLWSSQHPASSSRLSFEVPGVPKLVCSPCPRTPSSRG